MKQGIFESLTGHFLDGSPVENVPASSRRILSIMDHLKRMFNTRAGSLSHLPGYGLPDISEIYRKMPRGVEELQDAIARAIEMFEPRLINAKVTPGESQDDRFRLVFLIWAELKDGGRVRFQTTFTSMGISTIAPWRAGSMYDRQIL